MTPERVHECVLDAGEIQGNVLPGFDTRHQTLVFGDIVDAAAFRRWLERQVNLVTSLADVLGQRASPGEASPLWRNIAFSYRGLSRLTGEAAMISDRAFKEGMHRRSKLLGDSGDPDFPGSCGNWVVGGPPGEPDLLVLLASEDGTTLRTGLERLFAGAHGAWRSTFLQPGMKLRGPLEGREHFGFVDNISQPGVRGRLSGEPGGFLTPCTDPRVPTEGRPGQKLLWPGEFVLGYPGQDPMDDVRTGPVASAGPAWTRNGSFLVFRRLRQDVAAFHRFVSGVAGELARHAALPEVTTELVAAKLMGRWRSGAALVQAPVADDPGIGIDPQMNNRFVYAGALNAGSRSLRDGRGPGGRMPADPVGIACPIGAHIRRVYPRDAATGETSAAAIETHRLLRRSIPFGDPYPGPGERGLLFLAYQSSIERQFEFVTRAWVNNPHLGATEGQDPIVGQNSEQGAGRRRTFVVPWAEPSGGFGQVEVATEDEWVTTTGGGYFFAPARSGLVHLATGPPREGKEARPEKQSERDPS